jgi:hypothetical protein
VTVTKGPGARKRDMPPLTLPSSLAHDCGPSFRLWRRELDSQARDYPGVAPDLAPHWRDALALGRAERHI